MEIVIQNDMASFDLSSLTATGSHKISAASRVRLLRLFVGQPTFAVGKSLRCTPPLHD